MKFIEYVVLNDDDIEDYGGQVPLAEDILNDDFMSIALYCIDTEEIAYFGNTDENYVSCEVEYFLYGVQFAGFDTELEKKVLVIPDDYNKYSLNDVKYQIRKLRGEF